MRLRRQAVITLVGLTAATLPACAGAQTIPALLSPCYMRSGNGTCYRTESGLLSAWFAASAPNNYPPPLPFHVPVTPPPGWDYCTGETASDGLPPSSNWPIGSPPVWGNAMVWAQTVAGKDSLGTQLDPLGIVLPCAHQTRADISKPPWTGHTSVRCSCSTRC